VARNGVLVCRRPSHLLGRATPPQTGPVTVDRLRADLDAAIAHGVPASIIANLRQQLAAAQAATVSGSADPRIGGSAGVGADPRFYSVPPQRRPLGRQTPRTSAPRLLGRQTPRTAPTGSSASRLQSAYQAALANPNFPPKALASLRSQLAAATGMGVAQQSFTASPQQWFKGDQLVIPAAPTPGPPSAFVTQTGPTSASAALRATFPEGSPIRGVGAAIPASAYELPVSAPLSTTRAPSPATVPAFGTQTPAPAEPVPTIRHHLPPLTQKLATAIVTPACDASDPPGCVNGLWLHSRPSLDPSTNLPADVVAYAGDEVAILQTGIQGDGVFWWEIVTPGTGYGLGRGYAVAIDARGRSNFYVTGRTT
jgi:hypothetical protein